MAERQFREEPSGPLPFMELKYFNGLGGFTEDGKEYAIYLGEGTRTPAPWVNVMANPHFGTLVSESGASFTWCGNSQSHRITPWSNDPCLIRRVAPFTSAMTTSASSGRPRRRRFANWMPTARGTGRDTRSLNTTATPSSRSC
jgi:hypothetical protein